MAPVYVLDAGVLYPVVLRDLLLTLGALDALEPRWTESILDEMTRNVLADMFWSIDPRGAATRTTLRTIFECRDVAKSKWAESAKSLVFDLETCGNGDTRWNRRLA